MEGRGGTMGRLVISRHYDKLFKEFFFLIRSPDHRVIVVQANNVFGNFR